MGVGAPTEAGPGLGGWLPVPLWSASACVPCAHTCVYTCACTREHMFSYASCVHVCAYGHTWERLGLSARSPWGAGCLVVFVRPPRRPSIYPSACQVLQGWGQRTGESPPRRPSPPRILNLDTCSLGRCPAASQEGRSAHPSGEGVLPDPSPPPQPPAPLLTRSCPHGLPPSTRSPPPMRSTLTKKQQPFISLTPDETHSSSQRILSGLLSCLLLWSKVNTTRKSNSSSFPWQLPLGCPLLWGD